MWYLSSKTWILKREIQPRNLNMKSITWNTTPEMRNENSKNSKTNFPKRRIPNKTYQSTMFKFPINNPNKKPKRTITIKKSQTDDPYRKSPNETSEMKFIGWKLLGVNYHPKDPKLQFPNECVKATDPEWKFPSERSGRKFQHNDRKRKFPTEILPVWFPQQRS